jgi:putative hydrolase of HD superfamily
MTNKPTLLADVNFLFEMGNIRLIKRMGSRFLGAFEADLADHHFRVFWIAMAIAANEEGADTGKVAKLAMVHDIAESRTGDVDYLARQYVERNEKLAIEDMLAGTSFEKEFYELWEEYEKCETLEAKIVKDADNLDVDFELAEKAASGHELPKIWEKHRIAPRSKLYTDSARKLCKEFEQASPHDWHLKGRNRNNHGDWKQT